MRLKTAEEVRRTVKNMRKVAIVGVEGSGKTVMLACLGELYAKPDDAGYFLRPKNFQTASYVMKKISSMRKGVWPMATADDAMQGLDWMLCRKDPHGGRPQDVCEISFLDFGGEVYRAAFGIRGGNDRSLAGEIASLKDYLSNADDLIVLINLRDVISKGIEDERVQESVWITNSILATALDSSTGKTAPRASIAITQADSYAATIEACGGAKGVLEAYLPHVANSYDWLDIFDVTAVDKTILDDDGNAVPAPDFQPEGLRVLMEWITASSGEPDRATGPFDEGEEAAAADEQEPVEEEIAEPEEQPQAPMEMPKPCLYAKRILKVYRYIVLGLAVILLIGLMVDKSVNGALCWLFFAVVGGVFEAAEKIETAIEEGKKWPRNLLATATAIPLIGILTGVPGLLVLSLALGVPTVLLFQESSNAWFAAWETNGPALELVRLRRLAEKGDAVSQCNLGVRYLTGRGVKQDMAEAVKWYWKAANQGLAVAQSNLGACYYNGYGVVQNKDEAVKWWRLAARQGDENAKRALREIS